MQRLLTIAIASTVGACGSVPEYCSGTTDTRHVGTWEITYSETGGDCGPLNDQAVTYPPPSPPKGEEEREAWLDTYFGRIRQKAWLQADCTYEGSHRYEASPPPKAVKDNNEPWPASSTQVSDVLSADDAEISGTMDLTMESDYRGLGACNSGYAVDLVRVE